MKIILIYSIFIFIALLVTVMSGKKFFSKNKKKLHTVISFIIMVIGIGVNGFLCMSLYQNLTNKRPDMLATVSVKFKAFDYKLMANDTLSNQKVENIEKNYTKQGQSVLDNLYKNNTTSKNYALTLIGKQLPETTFKDVDDNSYTINKNTIIVVMTDGDKSKKFIDGLNKVADEHKEDNVQLLVMLPSLNKDDARKFYQDNKINSMWHLITSDDNKETSTQPALMDLCKNYYNVVGAPSYIALNDHNKITLAGTGAITSDSFNNFYNQSFKTPYIYTMTKSTIQK